MRLGGLTKLVFWLARFSYRAWEIEWTSGPAVKTVRRVSRARSKILIQRNAFKQ